MAHASVPHDAPHPMRDAARRQRTSTDDGSTFCEDVGGTWTPSDVGGWVGIAAASTNFPQLMTPSRPRFHIHGRADVIKESSHPRFGRSDCSRASWYVTNLGFRTL